MALKNYTEGSKVNKLNKIVDINLVCVCLEVALIVEICNEITHKMRNLN